MTDKPTAPQPSEPSRSVQRREALQKGETMPTFSQPDPLAAPPTKLVQDCCDSIIGALLPAGKYIEALEMGEAERRIIPALTLYMERATAPTDPYAKLEALAKSHQPDVGATGTYECDSHWVDCSCGWNAKGEEDTTWTDHFTAAIAELRAGEGKGGNT